MGSNWRPRIYGSSGDVWGTSPRSNAAFAKSPQSKRNCSRAVPRSWGCCSGLRIGTANFAYSKTRNAARRVPGGALLAN